MREYIDGKDVANTVMMLGSAFKGTVAVVEGITDRRLYGKFFDERDVEVVIAHSKTNVRTSVREAYAERRFKNIIGIMDADLDYMFQRKRFPPLFLTDTRDLEGMLLKSDALDSILHEYGDNERIERFEETNGNIRDAVLSACYPIGMLMYVSDTYGLGLSFKDLDFEYFIDRRTLRCDVKKLMQNIVSRSNNGRPVSSRDLANYMTRQEEQDPWVVCRGHDLMSVLAIGLRYIFGGSNSRNISECQLSGGFRLAFRRENLESTILFRDTSEWCNDKRMKLWSVRR